MKMNSTTSGQHTFAKAPQAEIPRSTFNRTCGNKTTFNAGELIPVFVDHALPGDTFSMDAAFFGRLATQLKPIMDNLYLDFHFWAVPNRLVWENWERFNGAQDNPDDSTDFLVPEVTVPSGGFAQLSVWDYLGIPPDIEHGTITALVPRAMNLIWNEWYRDQNLQDSVPVNKDDGPDADTDYEILKRGKRHDYFTSCLPWPQKGPAVELPLGSSAPMTLTDGTVIGSGTPTFDLGGTTRTIGHAGNSNAIWSGAGFSSNTADWDDPNLELDDLTGSVDLSAATASTINTIRLAFQIQKLYERDARGGTRYVELLKSHFGVTSPDFRLQRPEYLGGGTTGIVVNPAVSTIDSTLISPPSYIGDLRAYATATQNGVRWTKSFTEHCVILGFVSLRADLNYQQGLDRFWSKTTRWDHYWPALSHLGEQAVLNKEIYAQGTSADDDVFGYQERYAEYRYKPSTVTGQYRSTNDVPLDVWHLAQNFGSLPTLGADFIEENPPVDRIIAVNTDPQFQMDAYFNLKCARPMPTYSVPGLVDHF